jgi:hypothetical protein
VTPCTGCRFLVQATHAVCSATDGPFTYVVNPYTGRSELQGIRLRPDVAEQRAPGAPCGPDRRLYQPRLWRRVWQWLSR